MDDNEEKIMKLAALAKIRLSPEEARRLGADIEAVMQKFSELDAYDTSGIEPLISPNAGSSPLREDEVKAQDAAAEILSNAPDTDEGKEFFAVPKVMAEA